MKRLLILAVLLCGSAQAQTPSPDEINGQHLMSEQMQRAARDMGGKMMAEIARLTKELEAAKKECKPVDKDAPK